MFPFCFEKFFSQSINKGVKISAYSPPNLEGDCVNSIQCKPFKINFFMLLIDTSSLSICSLSFENSSYRSKLFNVKTLPTS